MTEREVEAAVQAIKDDNARALPTPAEPAKGA